MGRQAELDAARSALDAARAGEPRILLIEGEPGIGKTAFVRRFLSRAADVMVLEASGEEMEAALDYGVLDQLLARATPDPGEGASGGSVFTIGAELLTLLGSLQDHATVALLIDDAHWMDAPSAGALLFALRRLYVDRILVLIVTRPDGIARLGPSWLRLLADPERVQRVILSGLTARDVSLLAESLGFQALTPASAERLREHRAGIRCMCELCCTRSHPRHWPSNKVPCRHRARSPLRSLPVSRMSASRLGSLSRRRRWPGRTVHWRWQAGLPG